MVESEIDDLDIEALYNKAFPPEYLEELKQKKEITGDDGITRQPACWSPYFVLMKLTNQCPRWSNSSWRIKKRAISLESLFL